MKTSFNKKNPKRILGYLMAFAMVLFSANAFSQCDHSLNMYDSFGDGWNGSSVDVTVNGAVVVAGAMVPAGGSSASATFSASTGDAIDLANWVTGSWTSEVSWDITDGDGTIIASGVHGGSGASTGYCAPPPPCGHALNMYDSFGDGWNGSSVDVTVNGAVVVAGAMVPAGGSSAVASFSAASGDAIDLANWVTGSWTSEVSWDITDGGGTVIASGVHGGSGASVGNCPSVLPIPGCMDPLATNYNALANVDDGSCAYACASGIGANSESFEDPAMGLYSQGPWANWTYDAANSTFTGTNGWRKDNLGTGSSGTGPTNGAPSLDGAYYLYCETSGQYGKVAILNSSCVDLSNFADPNFVFGYHMAGATMGTLNCNVSADGGATWTTEWTLTGDQGTNWLEGIVSLTAYSGQIVEVQLHYTSGTSFTGDCAIDFLRFMEAPLSGCMDPAAANYDPAATIDDGSCQYPGCMDPGATNYCSTCNVNDSASCTYPASNVTPFCEDVESGSSATNGWVLAQQPYASAMAWGGGATFVVNGHPGNNGPIAGNYSMKFEGGDAPTGWTGYATEALAYANVTHVSSATIMVDMTGAAASCEMSFDLDLFSGFSNVGYSNMRIQVGGVVLADVNGVTCHRSNQAPWTGACPAGTVTYNMSAYSGSVISVMFEFAGKYSTNYSNGLYGNVALVDNICFYDLQPCTYYAGAASSTDVTCNGGSDGSATASASGGSGSDTYAWDNGATTATISGLAAGTYTCIVTDATYGCSDTVSAVVGEPSSISLSAVVGNESAAGANDGQVNLSVSGGTPCITAVTLPVSLAGGNGQSGTGFNVINTSAGSLTITGFSQGPGTGNSSNPGVLCEVYENGGGSYLQTGNVFTLHSSATVVLTSGAATGYVPCNIVIPAGGTVGVWIGIAVGTIQYTNGSGTPGVTPWASDANITLTEGHGGTYPLGLNFNPRNFNGAIHYGDPSASAYTFAWSNGATSQSLSAVGAGTYSVTATDCAGCTETASYTVITSATPGCTDSTASNYNALATVDDGSCFWYGCTDPAASNYNATATVDDSSCVYPCSYYGQIEALITCGGGSWQGEVSWDVVDDATGAIVASGGAPYNASVCLPGGCYSVNMYDSFGDGWNGNVFTITDVAAGTSASAGLLSGSSGSASLSAAGLGCTAPVPGCTDPAAPNYNSAATVDDGSCCYDNWVTLDMQDSFGDGWNGNTWTATGGTNTYGPYTLASGLSGSESFCMTDDCYDIVCDFGSWQGEVSWTLTDASGTVIASGGAPYNAQSAVGSASCAVYGCTDTTACNYDPLADTDDGSCILPDGCTDSTAFNYNPLALCDDGSCQPVLMGCTDSTALNYYPSANVDDGSCVYPPTCGSITGVNMTDVIHDRATFNWDDMNGGAASCVVDQIRIQYREVGSSSWSSKTMGAPVGNNAPCLNTSKRVLNLSASTQYEYEFKIWYQDGTVVGFDNQGTFTTLAACAGVTNVTATPTSQVGQANFCWTAPSSPYSFVRLKYREDVAGSSFTNIGGMGVMSPQLCKTKNNIPSGLTYRVMWRTWCNPTGGPYRSAGWDGPTVWTQTNPIRVEGGTTINNLDVYPNPSRDIFNVTFTSEDVQNLDVRIINVIGEVVYTENLSQFVGQYTKQVDLATYTKGVYFLEITTDNGVINKKLILQ